MSGIRGWRAPWWGLAALHLACGSRSSLELSRQAGTATLDAGQPPDAAPLDCFGDAVTILADDPQPTGLAVDETRVYWTSSGPGDCTNGRIRAVPKAGGEVVTLVDHQLGPRAIVLDAERLYFYGNCGPAALGAVQKTGGELFDFGLSVRDVSRPTLALSGGYVYFNKYGAARVPTAGGAVVDVDTQDYVYAMIGDDRGVYWTGPTGGTSPLGVFALEPGHAAPTRIATRDVSQGIALDADWVYFASYPGIYRVPRRGGDVEFVTTASAWKLALDDRDVYWSEGVLGGNASIKKAPKAGGGPVAELATTHGAYLDVAVDERCVYWADLYAQTVGRAPKR